MVFQDSLNKLQQTIEAQELNILVWGSGVSAPEDYAKREKIRESVQSQFNNAEVRFSEDLELSEVLSDAQFYTVPEQELFHLAACDVCVVLDTSAGAAAEIAHFGNSPYAKKLLIFTHEQYRNVSSFPGELRKSLNQFFYTEAEYKSCTLVDRVIARVRVVAFGKVGNLPV